MFRLIPPVSRSDGSVRNGGLMAGMFSSSSDGSVKGGHMFGGKKGLMAGKSFSSSNEGSVKGGHMFGGKDDGGGMMTIVEGQPSFTRPPSDFLAAKDAAQSPTKAMTRRVTFNDNNKKMTRRRGSMTEILFTIAKSAPSITHLGNKTGAEAAAAAAAPAARELTQKTGTRTGCCCCCCLHTAASA